MADPNFSWIYLVIFLAIPLARIIPRILARKRMKNSPSQTIQERPIQPDFNEYARKSTEHVNPQKESSKPQTKDRLVLGELNRGAKTFENIQKNTGFTNEELDAILQNLEEKGMLNVQQKQGLFGTKIELHLTDKGISGILLLDHKMPQQN